MKRSKSVGLYRRATQAMAGGVSSPVRAFKSVGGDPVFFRKGKGPYLWDVDANRYTDYVCSWGAIILGHSDPQVLAFVRERMRGGTSFGAPTEGEVLLGEKIKSFVPSVERLRFVNSGTEATMSAVRVARGFTGRSMLVKFEGCYHGHADPFLTMAGSGLASLDLPASKGVTRGSIADTATLPYNDPGSVEALFRNQGDKVAAVIVEPVAGNMGVVPPKKGFLESLRRHCTQAGALLIFDEVITGFRVGMSGAQGVYGVKPDITTLGKVIGGGFPLAAYGGRRDIMAMVAPDGPVYQAGTLSGNPVATAAGLKTLQLLGNRSYSRLEERSKQLEEGIASSSHGAGVEVTVNRVGSMTGVFFAPGKVENFSDAKKTDTRMYSRFFHSMLDSGCYLPPSAFETIFVSTAHADADVESTVDSMADGFRAARGSH